MSEWRLQLDMHWVDSFAATDGASRYVAAIKTQRNLIALGLSSADSYYLSTGVT